MDLKKSVAVIALIIVVIAAALFLTKGREPKEPFTFTYDTNNDSIAGLTVNDDMADLVSCSPFYEGAKQFSGIQTNQFDDMRERKVQEIIKEADGVANTAKKMKSDLQDMRTRINQYITTCMNAEPKSMKYAHESGKLILSLMIKEAVVEAQYDSYKDTNSIDHPFAKSFTQYLKVAKGVKMGALYVEDINNLLVIAALGVEASKNSSNVVFKDASAKLNQDMSKYDSLIKQTADLMRGIYSVNYGLKQLATADYYYASSAVTFISEKMPELKKTAAGLKPTKYLDASDIKFITSYLAKYDSLSKQMARYLSSVPKSKLIDVSLYMPYHGYAVAQSEAQPSSMTLMAQGTQALGKSIADGISSLWSKGKAAANAGWEGAKTVVHGVQSTAGLVIDVAGTGVANVSRIPVGLYYGNTIKECWQDMEANSKQIITSWKNNKSGSSTLRTAKQYFDGIDDGGEYVVSKGVEKVIGEGWISWGTGKVGKAVVGMFTGLGKGISLVGNRDANTSDYVIGTIEIVGSALGGSKLIIRGTQLPGLTKGLAESSWIGAKGTWNIATKIINKLDKNEALELIKSAASQGIKTPGLTAKVALADAMIAAANQANAALKTELKAIIEAGVKAGWTNFNQTLRSSLNDFVKKEFTVSLKSLVSIVGDTPGEFIDNVIGQWADDALKEIVDQAMAEPPQPFEMKGTWTGDTLITSVTVPEASEKAKKEGCNLDQIKKLQGKKCTTTIHLSGSSGGAGSSTVSIAFSAGKGQPISGTYTYSNGDFESTSSQKGATITFRGKATRMTQGLEIKGDMHLRWGGEGVFISMTGNFDVSKSH